MRYGWFAALSFALLISNASLGCNSVCTPGQQIVCPCPGGDIGVQTCEPGGASYSACLCPGDGQGGSAGQGGDGTAGQGGASTGGGGGSASCTDECAPADPWCQMDTLYSCGDVDADPCLEVIPEGPCPPGMCDGPTVMDCGNCGTQTRTCDNGSWSGWSACTGEGPCAPNETMTCGNQGTQTCTSACEWGPCGGQSCDGPTMMDCGNCGTQTRTCDNGSWSGWSACMGEGECSPGDVQSCPGGTKQCSASCQFGSCEPPCPSGQFEVVDYEYPSYGPAGCSGDGVGKLQVSAEMTTATVVKFYVKKQDGTAFGQAATLTVYVGDGPTCSPANVPNVVKTSAAVVVGQPVQEVVLTVNPYNGGWNMGETKKFWVGKSEGGFPAYRATGVVNVKKICTP